MAKRKLYVVTYTANEANDHECDSCYHTKLFEKSFKDAQSASDFLAECTSPQKDLKIVTSVEPDSRQLNSWVDSDGIELYY